MRENDDPAALTVLRDSGAYSGTRGDGSGIGRAEQSLDSQYGFVGTCGGGHDFNISEPQTAGRQGRSADTAAVAEARTLPLIGCVGSRPT